MGDLYWSSLANSLTDYDWCNLLKRNHFQRGVTVLWPECYTLEVKLRTIDTSVRYKYSTITGTGIVQDYLSKIPYPAVKAVLDNAIIPLTDRAEQGVQPNPDCQNACQEETLGARPARLATTNVTD